MQVQYQIYHGDRGQGFIDLIKGFLKKGNLPEKYIEAIVSPDTFELWDKAFTHKSANQYNNYEFIEILGDSIINATIVMYMDERFPEIRCPGGVQVLGRLKINYVSQNVFFSIARDLNFWPYITANNETRQKNKKPLLEDCLEAVFGLTTSLLNKKIRKNVGFAIIPDIVESLYKNIDISLDYYKLYDSKSILKQIFDKRKELGEIVYTHSVLKNVNNDFTYSSVKIFQKVSPHESHIIGEGVGSLKANAEQNAAKNAIQYLSTQNVYPEIPDGFMGKTCIENEVDTGENNIEIYQGSRGDDFKQLIKNFLKRGKMKEEFIDAIVSPDTMDEWDITFTHQSANQKDNYEYTRFIGHTITNSLLVWYFNHLFPQIQCPAGVPIMARLKIIYSTKKTFYGIAKKLGIWQYITTSVDVRTKNTEQIVSKCLEAIFGTTARLLDKKIKKNLSLAIIPNILKSIYDEMVTISLDYFDLHDAKTLLKQVFDKKPGEELKYTFEIQTNTENENISYVQIFITNSQTTYLVGEGYGNNKADAEQQAAKKALKYLSGRGVNIVIPPDYLMFCDK